MCIPGGEHSWFGISRKSVRKCAGIELTNAKLAVAQQKSINVLYNGQIVGDYVADFLVEGSVLVELKATRALDDIHMAQCLNYLKATGLKVCLLINFGQPRIEVKRIVNGFSDQRSSAFIGGYVKNPT